MMTGGQLKEQISEMMEYGESKVAFVRFSLFGEVITLPVDKLDRGYNGELIILVNESMSWQGIGSVFGG